MGEKTGSAALAGLVGHYGSGDSSGGESDGEAPSSPWSVCMDANTGCPYYWNQITNEVSWEPPPPQPHPPAPSNRKPLPSSAAVKAAKKPPQQRSAPHKPIKRPRPQSSDEDEKIELITSYYNSDSGSGEEDGSKLKTPKETISKQGGENSNSSLKYGPELPKDVKLNSTPPMGEIANFKLNPAENITNGNSVEEKNSADKSGPVLETENLHELMATQANLLKKLGKLGPNDIKFLNGSSAQSPILNSRTQSPLGSPLTPVDSLSLKKSNALDMDVDDLIAQIEMEQPIDQPSITSDAQSTETAHSQDESATAKSTGTENSSESKNGNPFKPLFPSTGFPKPDQSSVNSDKATDIPDSSSEVITSTAEVKSEIASDKSIVNKYDASLCGEGIENSAFKRKRRIALDILPVNKQTKPDNPLLSLSFSRYGNNYGVSGERKGLGFKTDGNSSELQVENSKMMYANFKKGASILFEKGDNLNPEKPTEKDGEKKEGEEASDSMVEKKDLIEAKLKFLTQSLAPVSPVQQLAIELQTLWGALASGALQTRHMDEWLSTADSTLGRLEAGAAPHPWICRFHSEAGCYVYEHSETGQWQWEYPEPNTPPPPSSPPPAKPPAPPSPPPDEPTDMDISTTPPPQPHSDRLHYGEDTEPLPPGVETPIHRSSPHMDGGNLQSILSQGIETKIPTVNLTAELDSFYSDLASLETPEPPPTDPSKGESKKEVQKKEPPKKLPPIKPVETISPSIPKEKKKKTKAPSVGMKSKSVSTLVAKWKKVQESLDD